ncbi:hypothetical protein [Simiaoa sunii]|jgi:hypothetical protein|uniref:Uncharacterized protein n=1 Tax=Simiaoa sunii TaxID=2763672 RepID=A0A7G9FU22_9FIRM|nr:hypothetical protein [Simiaoa sunii]QNM02054.1 hypothetical protein H9Q77_13365 [Simiaoa sunii]
MGEVTNQYSAEEIIEKYHKHIHNYNSIIEELKNIMENAYIKKQNIGDFFELHLRFCVEAVNVLSEAIETIQNDMVNESMCMRLEGLFNSCAREHKDLEDVYSNVKYNDEICGYEDVLIRLRDECEDMEYCDETVKFVRATIRNTINANNFYGDVKNIQIQQGTRNSLQKACESTYSMRDTIIEKERTSVKEILKSKAYEGIVACVLFAVASILYNVLTKEMLEKIQSSTKIFLLFTMAIFFVFGIGLLIICVYDIINMLPLMTKGAFVELESKIEWLDKFLAFFQKSDELVQKDIRTTGKCYKNIDGVIYRIKGKKCPYCETQPIGEMFLNYSNYKKMYFWECNQNQSHVVEFDYKKKI